MPKYLEKQDLLYAKLLRESPQGKEPLVEARIRERAQARLWLPTSVITA